MILNNFYGKFDSGINYQENIDENIEIFKYAKNCLMSKSKSKKNSIKNHKLNSSKEMEIKNEVSLVENKSSLKEKTKLYHKISKHVSIYDLDSSCEKHEDQQKKFHTNRNKLFTAMTVDAKLATNTSYFNLKSPINYNLKKIDGIKLPKLIEQDDSRVPFNIKRVLPKSKNCDYFSLPQISNNRHAQGSNQLCLRSEKAYLADKNRLKNEDLIDFESNRKNQIDIFNENHFSKQKFEIFLRNKNRRKEHAQEAECNEARKTSKTIKKEKSKNSLTPSVKCSEVNEKIYLEIFIPTVV